VSAESNLIYDEDDLALAEDLAARAGWPVENARLYSERDYIATTLQQSLMPERLPDIPGVDLAARYRAAGEGDEVGGDFYDIFRTGEYTMGHRDRRRARQGPARAVVTGAGALHAAHRVDQRDAAEPRARHAQRGDGAAARRRPLLHGGLASLEPGRGLGTDDPRRRRASTAAPAARRRQRGDRWTAGTLIGFVPDTRV
jgi:hypothetical protein